MRISGCRLRGKTQDRLAEFFVGGVTARSAADLARVNRKTAAYFFHRLRQIIARQLEDSLPVEGLVEVDESYFGGVRKGRRGGGAAGKVPVFGILKRGGKVTTVMIPDVRKDTLLPIIRQKGVPDSIVYIDSYPAYDVLDASEFHHHRIDHSDAYALDRHNHINGNRKLLEPGQADAQPIQRHSESPLSPLSQGDRISLQLRNTQPAIANPQTLGQTQPLAQPHLGQPQTLLKLRAAIQFARCRALKQILLRRCDWRHSLTGRAGPLD
jgi:transposase